MKRPTITSFAACLALVALSSLFGLRLVNEFLRLNDRAQGSYSYSFRDIDNGESLRVAHPEDYEIKSTGSSTLVFISDSFGEGVKCGNNKNIAGCLDRSSEYKIVNLSKGGEGPAFYLSQLRKYLINQRNLKTSGGQEAVVISLYSNDILLDREACEYFFKNQERLKKSIVPKSRIYLQGNCQKKLALSDIEYAKSKNYSLPFAGLMSNLFGYYSYTLIRELIAQTSLMMRLDTKVGRAGYVPKWGNELSPERSLLLEILNDINQTCVEYNCNVVFSTFPNVENLKPDSSVRQSLISFADYALRKGIKIEDGYEPFIANNITSSSYSLTDIHSSCDGYQLYSDWVLSKI